MLVGRGEAAGLSLALSAFWVKRQNQTCGALFRNDRECAPYATNGMATEIATLVAMLPKVRAVRQGKMQELLIC